MIKLYHRANMVLIRCLAILSREFTVVFRKWRGRAANLAGWGSSRVRYDEWIARYDSKDDSLCDAIAVSIAAMPRLPLISVVMPVYNPVPAFLESAIQSVRNQLYPHWELCIADDASTDPRIAEILRKHRDADHRIKVVFRVKNGHISEASNSALELVTGEYIALLDHDDMLAQQALYRAAVEIVSHPEAMLIYSDEDKIDTEGKRSDPHFKSDWNPDLFLTCNMINHLGVYKTSIIREIGGFRKGLEGAQDYDLGLRFIEKTGPGTIRHIPRILYHWRLHENSMSLVPESKPYAETAAERAINDYFDRQGLKAKATHAVFGYRTRYALPVPPPRVSLIIVGRNAALLSNCIRTLLDKSTYSNLEILAVGKAPPSLIKCLGDERVRILGHGEARGKSALRNRAAAMASGTVLGFIDSSLEALSEDWLEEMASHACRPEVGAVGARLFYPGTRLYHGGMILGMRGKVAGYAHRGRRHAGYYGRAALTQCFSAVSGRCMFIRKELFQQVSGFNEALSNFADVDLCLRLREAGYRNIWTPYAQFRFLGICQGFPRKGEIAYMKENWGSLLACDPAYNPNLTLDFEDFSLAHTPRVRISP